MKYEIKNQADELVEVNFSGHMLAQYGLRSGAEIETGIGTGRAVGVSHLYHNRESFSTDKGQVQHMIVVALNSDTQMRLTVEEALGGWARVSDREFNRWMVATELGLIYRRVSMDWDEYNVAQLYE